MTSIFMFFSIYFTTTAPLSAEDSSLTCIRSAKIGCIELPGNGQALLDQDETISSLGLVQRSAHKLLRRFEDLNNNTKFKKSSAGAALMTNTESGRQEIARKQPEKTIIKSLPMSKFVTQQHPPIASTLQATARGEPAAFVFAVIAGSIFTASFMSLRKSFPLIYSRNVCWGLSPRVPSDDPFGWARTSLSTSVEEASETMGLDSAMVLEFTHLCMRISARIGIPMLLVMGPLHMTYGSTVPGDNMSRISMGNLPAGSRLYWVHAVSVWGVALVVVASIFGAQEDFITRRMTWLKEMPEPRANTVLVEAIPEDLQSDAKLQDYFERMFAEGKVKTAYVVKKAHPLATLIMRKEASEKALREAEHTWNSSGRHPNYRPTARGGVDAISKYRADIAEFKNRIKEERTRIREAASEVGGVNTSNGFVTFFQRSDAEIAQNLQYQSDAEAMVVSMPPEPSSILWSDLEQDPGAARLRTFFGYILLVGLCIAYMPSVVAITNIAREINLGPLQPIWAGLAPTVGLQVMVAFIPTCLVFIFRWCFTLKDDAWAQHLLQNWYFAFQVIFVILVTSVGSSVVFLTRSAITEPFELLKRFATMMPFQSHFYASLVILTWVTHAMALTRYSTVTKFLAYREIYDERDAANMCEPEDQDYYGVGSRCARFTVTMLIGIIYCNMCPPIMLLVLINFIFCRTTYGYLLCYAEPRKSDLGGVFWVTQLKHLFLGLAFYVFLMTAILLGRTSSVGPAAISASCLLYLLRAYYRFQTRFCWEKLPFCEITEASYDPRLRAATYMQPCLIEQP